MSQTHELIDTAYAHLRRAHSDGRRDRLIEAGLPADDRKALAAWIRHTEDAMAIERGCVFLAGTARIKNGVAEDLPVMKHWGCRVERIEMSAERIGVDEDDPAMAQWCVHGGNCGVGFSESVYVTASRDAEATEVIAMRRQVLLNRGDCFATRAEAEADALRQLRERATN